MDKKNKKTIQTNPYNIKEVLEKVDKFDIVQSNNSVLTTYDKRVVSHVEVSNKYFTFNFKDFTKSIVNQINKYFDPVEYQFRISGGVQEVRLYGESVKVGDDDYYKMFSLINSTDKTRTLQINIGLIRKENNSPIIMSVTNENASVRCKHFYKALPERLDKFFKILPEFDLIVDRQIKALNSLNQKKLSLSKVFKQLMKKDEDGIVKPSYVLKARAFSKQLMMAELDELKTFGMQEYQLLLFPKRFAESGFDIKLNKKKILDLYIQIFKNYDSTVVERETRRMVKILLEIS